MPYKRQNHGRLVHVVSPLRQGESCQLTDTPYLKYLALDQQDEKIVKSEGGSISICRLESIIVDTAWDGIRHMKTLTLTLNQICHGCPGRASKALTVALAMRLGVADTTQFHHLTENTLNSLYKVGLLKTT